MIVDPFSELYEVGDRVIYRGRHKGTILEIYDGSVFSFKKDKALIDFEKGEMLCFISNIEIDKEWYREEKLKELGI